MGDKTEDCESGLINFKILSEHWKINGTYGTAPNVTEEIVKKPSNDDDDEVAIEHEFMRTNEESLSWFFMERLTPSFNQIF